MTGIFINGISGKMGTNLLERSNSHDDIVNCNNLNDDLLDTIIDFSHPDSTLKLLESISNINTSIIIGTTGFDLEQIEQIKEFSKNKKILLAFNLSKGMSVIKKSVQDFIRLNTKSLNCFIEDSHHAQKVDSPSGTAIELKNIIELNDKDDLISDIEIISRRSGNIFGIHKVIFLSDSEKIEFRHEAISRNIFSDGALEASHWIKNQKEGLYNFEDFLKS